MATEVDPRYKAGNYAEQLKSYIPTAATALYIAALGLLTVEKEPLQNEDYYVRGAILVCAVIVAAVLAVMTYPLDTLKKSAEARRRTLVTVPIVVLAFLLYSMATPGGVWQGSLYPGVEWSALGVILGGILTILLPKVAQFLGFEPLDLSKI